MRTSFARTGSRHQILCEELNLRPSTPSSRLDPNGSKPTMKEGKVSSHDFGLPALHMRSSADDMSLRSSSPVSMRSRSSSPVPNVRDGHSSPLLCTSEPPDAVSQVHRPSSVTRKETGLLGGPARASSPWREWPSPNSPLISLPRNRRHTVSSAAMPMRCAPRVPRPPHRPPTPWLPRAQSHRKRQPASTAGPVRAAPLPVCRGRAIDLHSLSSTRLCTRRFRARPRRYVEWTPDDEPTRRRGRLVVQSERNTDFLDRMQGRQLQAGSHSEEAVAFAVKVLRENFLFSQMDGSTRRHMIHAMTTLNVEAGETLFSVGDTDDRLYLVLEGELVLAIPTHEQARWEQWWWWWSS